jgi:uncharacterized protein YcnI
MPSPRINLSRAPRVAAAAGALAAVAVLAAAGSASAHVTVHPDSYAKGASDGTLTFRVPNEEDSARTTKVQVFFPAGHPVPGVLVAPLPGWTATTKVTKLKTPITTDDGSITEAVSEVDWTKGAIAPGQYQDFTVAFGQLPDDTDQLEFKALQTYSDGTIVRWIEQARPGQDEPENPAPVLKLTAAGSDAAGSDAAGSDGAGSDGVGSDSAGSGSGGDKAAAPPSATPATASAASTATTAKASSDDSTARGIGVAGLIVGVLGLAAAAFALLRGRSARS